MPTYRYPVLVCRDPAGGYSAVAVDGGAVGFGASAVDARNDLREFLRWSHKKSP
ncbi:MAG: ATP-dependent Clp protease ATP-binding subunit, partial [Gemmataceae bacterium]|nr:ATP-dependent Clp protease ATP-binding subunit [Gemmataceae bacterium]